MLFERGKHSNIFTSIFLAICLLGSGIASRATAQNYNTEVKPLPDSVTVRSRPEYDAVGIQAGSFIFRPSASISEIYDDNVYATNTNRKSDFLTELTPRIEADSNWNRHALNFAVSGDLGYHASATTEDYKNFSVRQSARIDVGAMSSLNENGYFERYQEARTSVDDPGGVSPVKIDRKGGALEYRHQGGTLFGSVRATIADSIFHNTFRSDGSVINNHFRDRTTGAVDIEVGYDSGGLIRPFVQLSGMKVNFKEPVDQFDVNRDSTGYAINGGILFPVTALIQGRVFAGYIARNFKDPQLKDVHTAGYGGTLIWSPDRSTSIKLQGLKTVLETTLVQASSAVASSASIAVDKELRQNLLVHGQAQFERIRYTGIARTDNTWQGQINLTYLLNRVVRASVRYDYARRNAKNVPTFNDYRRNQINLTVHIQL
jgi:hypothetical protein